jgi:hypothetical protein
LFEREHHRNVALVLQALDPHVLAQRSCWFGGGTAMALRYGEYRESLDIDFLVSDRAGYRELRQMLGGVAGLEPLLRPGMAVERVREVRTDQYGIRTHIRSGGAIIKFEIVLEGRIGLERPEAADAICGVAALTPVDLAAEKLLANADRWNDDAVFSRDLVDLACQGAGPAVLKAASVKAEAAYGASIRASLAAAVEALRKRPHRLDECMRALRIDTVSKAQLWARVRRLQKVLPAPRPD